MKYKTFEQSKADHTRGEYLKNEYCVDKSLTSEVFVEQIKSAYYKFNAEEYHQGSQKRLTKPFIEAFKGVTRGRSVVDIGAGTGETYWLTREANYEFKVYYYIEPFQAMIDQFENKSNPSVKIINNYFESDECVDLLKNDTNEKVFIMCATLRVFDKIDLFLATLKESMNKGDVFFLPLEPNNEYFGKYYKNLQKTMTLFTLLTRAYKKLKNIVSRDNSCKSKGVESRSKSLAYLQKSGVVTSKFTTEMLYALTNYNNYLYWIDIDIPDQYNEGFFNIEYVVKELDCKITKFNTQKYLYNVSFGFLSVDRLIESILHRLFPRKGSEFAVVITKL